MSNEKERPKLQKVIKGNAGVKKQSNIGKIGLGLTLISVFLILTEIFVIVIY